MRAVLRSGFFLGLLLLGAGCGESGAPRDVETAADPHDELRRRLGLAEERVIHSVTLGGRGGDEHVVPSRMTVRPGDVVEFVAVDGRVHSVRFVVDSLTPAAADFLRRTGQLEGPPMVERGSRFVLTFRDAPVGRYPFRSEGTGGSAWGVLVVDGG